jgi:ferredoxin/flavodoxin
MKEMTHINIYYFSGTGNTAWMVTRLAGRLTELGDEVTAVSCEDIASPDVDPAACDVMGVAFPVYGSLAPPIVRGFLDRLPSVAAKPLFAVTTAGYAAGDTGWWAVRPLRAKGYELFLVDNVVVANNLYIPPVDVLPVTPPEKLPRRLARAGIKIAKLADLIHRRERHVRGAGPLGLLMGFSQRVGMKYLERSAIKWLSVDESCTQCGWCVDHCPVHNIEMTGDGIEFLDRCMLCMRCYSFCPSQSIQATDKTKNAKRYRRYGGPEGRPYPADR